MSTPANMPGAIKTPAGAVAKLITDLAEVADDGSAIDLEVVDSLAGLVTAYASLLQANANRTINRA
ncbi:hypothetical protein [Streptomyces gossypiisoli]|uniref:hypothetical protein n=1 Tax=Streptomyces gossypiisoli TaxID=2748864 RepID=UPI0015DA8BCE|nr:hypothetical protein [Streptomyces gossypiisoli]